MQKVRPMSEEHDETTHDDLFPVPLEQGGAELLPLPDKKKWDAIHQIFYQGHNYYRVVDVIEALEVTKDPADYWSLMKRRMKKAEGFDETSPGMMQFELKSPRDRRLRKQDYATRQAILRLVQSVLLLTRFRRRVKLRSAVEQLKLNRTEIVQRRVPANPIVKAGDVLKDDATRLLASLKDVVTETFAFERPKEALHDGIVITVARAAHTDLNPPGDQELLIPVTGIRRAPV